MTTNSIFKITSNRTKKPDDFSLKESNITTMMTTMTKEVTIVVPGEMIATSKHWMRGHGTFIEEDQIDNISEEENDQDMEIDNKNKNKKNESSFILSCLAGTVERINKLITVKPFTGRYRPEVGDLVIGRITEVQSKRWKVEIGSRQQAVLMLGSVNLPGGVQRRKLESDELQMRHFFQEGDLLVAEAQAFFGDGSMSLHTRSRKYGKLRNGMLLKVPSQLILRLKSHFHNLNMGIDLIIGVNGWIWISQKIKQMEIEDDLIIKEGFEVNTDNMYSDINETISLKTRKNIVRLAGSINLLASNLIPISDNSILRTYEASLEIEKLLNQNMDIDGDFNNDNDNDDNHQFTGFLDSEFKDSVLALLVASP